MKGGKRVVWLAFAAVVLLALFFRFYALDSVPPGLHYDEAIDVHLAQDIRAGARPIYFSQGWGREPLYHYLVALAMNWVRAPMTALHVTSGVLGTVFVAVAFWLLRRLFDWRVATIGGAWLACSFWAVSVSRLGVRDVAVQPLAASAMLALWQWKKTVSPSRKTTILWLGLGGVLMGLSLYTYQASRAIPVLVILFIAYSALLDAKLGARRWTGLVMALAIALVVAAPLATYLITHPEAESGRAFQGGPVQQLLEGNPGPALNGIFVTLEMFTIHGDNQVLYNVPGRPALAFIAGIGFYIGAAIALVQFRKSEFGFILLWFLLALAPAMVTFPSPNFPRTLLAQAPVAALIGIGIVKTGDWMAHVGHDARWTQTIVPALALLTIGQTTWQTWNDYFVTWASLKETRFQYNAGPVAAARYLDAVSDSSPVVLAGLFADDSDPYNFALFLRRRDLDLRWFNASGAFPVPASAHTLRMILYEYTPMSELVWSNYLTQTIPLTQVTGVYSVLQLDGDRLRANLERARGDVQSASGAALVLPISFGGSLSLLGYEATTRTLGRGERLAVLTHWQISRPGTPQPTAIFVHLTDASGKPIAQDDRLDYPHHGWQTGDEFVQLHSIVTPSNASPGTYSLRLGVYFRDTGARWLVAAGDHVSLGTVEIK